jgi:hypothetical protein
LDSTKHWHEPVFGNLFVTVAHLCRRIAFSKSGRNLQVRIGNEAIVIALFSSQTGGSLMGHLAARQAIIIGGGASGVLLAYQLLQDPDVGFRVTLIERRSEIGRGPAYHTSNPEHVLNVRAANMSALPDDPGHFWRWLSNSAEEPLCPDPYCFVPRRTYGDYLANLVAPFTSGVNTPARLTIVHGQCVDVSESPAGVIVTLADGSTHSGDLAVLATGNESPVAKFPCDADPWTLPSSTANKDATVLILGTGLTMIDYVSPCCATATAAKSSRCRGAACWPEFIVVPIRFGSKKRTFLSAPAQTDCCGGCVAALKATSLKAATGGA